MIEKIYCKDETIIYGYKNLNGGFVFHRDEKDGPASISKFKSVYYKHGKMHRYGGPAIIYSTGETMWCYKSKFITNEVKNWLHENHLEDNELNLSEEDVLALQFYLRSLE